MDLFRPLSKKWGLDVARRLREGPTALPTKGRPAVAVLDRQLCYTWEYPRPEFVEWARQQGRLRLNTQGNRTYHYYVPMCGLTVAWQVQMAYLRRQDVRSQSIPNCRVMVNPWRLGLSGGQIVDLLSFIFPHPEKIWVSRAEFCVDLAAEPQQVFRSLRVKYARQSSVRIYRQTTMYFHRPRSHRRAKSYDKRRQAKLSRTKPLTRIEITTDLPNDKPFLIDMLLGRWLPKENHWRNVLLYDVSGLDARRLKGGLQRAWRHLSRKQQQALALRLDLGAEWLRRHQAWLQRNRVSHPASAQPVLHRAESQHQSRVVQNLPSPRRVPFLRSGRRILIRGATSGLGLLSSA